MEKTAVIKQSTRRVFRNGFSLERREKYVGFLFALPSMIGFLLFILLPMIAVLLLSFSELVQLS
mgnify:CR=1 FL=1